MTERSTGDLSRSKQRIVFALIGVWVLSKGFRLKLLNDHGLFSWELWRFDFVLATALVLIGIVAFRVVGRYEPSDARASSQKPGADEPTHRSHGG